MFLKLKYKVSKNTLKHYNDRPLCFIAFLITQGDIVVAYRGDSATKNVGRLV